MRRSGSRGLIDLSAPIAPTRPDAASFERVEIRTTSHAAKVACFPLKITGGSTGPTRDVAIWPD